jgi:hypothetical protein
MTDEKPEPAAQQPEEQAPAPPDQAPLVIEPFLPKIPEGDDNLRRREQWFQVRRRRAPRPKPGQ